MEKHRAGGAKGGTPARHTPLPGVLRQGAAAPGAAAAGPQGPAGLRTGPKRRRPLGPRRSAGLLWPRLPLRDAARPKKLHLPRRLRRQAFRRPLAGRRTPRQRPLSPAKKPRRDCPALPKGQAPPGGKGGPALRARQPSKGLLVQRLHKAAASPAWQKPSPAGHPPSGGKTSPAG